ncbi:MAG: HlyC/CorC family transporter [Actinobacteria bacterium]|nr:HlyC/CorC family transporter [Actinomycetota bacterium]
MMTPLQVVLLVVLGLCIASSGFLSGSETAIVRVPRERAHQFAEQGRKGRHLEELLADLEGTIGTLLVANNFVNILAASVATALAIALVGATWGPWLATVVVTAIILIVGEITPKTLATRRPDQYALAVAGVLFRLTRILDPITAVFVAISRGILRVFKVTQDNRAAMVTEEDIRALAVLGERSGEIEPAEREIIDSLFEVTDRPVREVMTPRVDIVTLGASLTAETIRQAVIETGHSRYPVVEREGDLDHMLGVLNVKDLLRAPGDPTPEQLIELLREPLYIPESASVLEALQLLRHKRSGFAAVLDEHGSVEGILTIKDLVSELVGELQDEFDPGVPVTVSLGDNGWITDGRVTVEDLAEQTGADLPEGPYGTVGGLYLFVSGDIPREGDSIVIAGLRFTVLHMEGRRIDRLRVQRV